jgi:mannose-6-phosphate isomerase-like protein (cupin superfamily)
MELEYKMLSEDYDYLAPDGSEIRLLPTFEPGGLCHCTLPDGMTSKALKHKTVDDIWYILEGNGEVARKAEGGGT